MSADVVELGPPKVRDVAHVTVSRAVDGTRRRRRARGGDASRSSPVTVERVHPLVLAAARRAQRPGERIVVVDVRTVRLVRDA